MNTDDPYHDGGTRGASGPSASREAADADLYKGITNAAQRYVLIWARWAGEAGVTSAELREKAGTLHHGRVSSAITKQHIAGRLVRLVERRGHCHVYVLPEYVAGREGLPYRQQNPRLTADDVEEVMVTHRRTIPGCACGRAIDHPDAHRRHVAEEIVAAMKGSNQ